MDLSIQEMLLSKAAYIIIADTNHLKQSEWFKKERKEERKKERKKETKKGRKLSSLTHPHDKNMLFSHIVAYHKG